MKKRKVLIALLLFCMTSQFAVSREINENVNSGNRDFKLSGQMTGSVTNSGTGSVSVSTSGGTFTGSLKNLGGGNFTNWGTVFVGKNDKGGNDKVENNKGRFSNGGSITVNEGGTIENIDAFVNSGTITVNEGGSIVNNGSFVSSGNLTNKGNFTNSGLFNGSFTNEGLLKNLKDAAIFLTGDTTKNSGNIESEGTFLIAKGSEFINTGNISSSGQFSNLGTYTSETELLNSGYFTNDGDFSGGLINDGGTAANVTGTMDKVVNQKGGVFANNTNATLTDSIENKDGSTFKNQGKISGSVSNSNRGNFTNEGIIDAEVTNDNAVFNNENNGTLNQKFKNKNGGVLNNNSTQKISGEVDNDNATINNSGEIASTTLSNGAIVNNNAKGTLDTITGSSSTVNNSGTITGAISGIVSEAGGGLIVNNCKDGSISGTIKDAVTVNNSGTLKNTNIQDGASVNNSMDGKIEGTTNLTNGSNVYNDGLISGNFNVDNNSTLHLGANAKFDEDTLVTMNGHLDLRNDSFDDFSKSSNLFILPSSSVSVDLSSATGQTDKLWAVRGVTLEDFNFIPDTLVSNGFISKEDLEKNMGLRKGQLTIEEGISHKELSPLRWLNATSSAEGIGYAPTGNSYNDFNPAVMAAPVAAQIGGYLNQLNSYDEAFRNMDMYMLMTKSQRQAMKNRNKYAAADSNLVFDPTNTPYDNTSAWFRPYATFENVKLKGGPKVSNVAWGSFFGVDSELMDLGHGWDGMFGAYLGYNGSHQAYDGIDIYQNGATLGLVGMAYKDNFFAGLTANVGSNIANADTMYGSDDFTLLMSGIAAKTGYNWELADGRFIIQPSYMMSYSFVNTFDYTNSAGIRVNSDPLNAITFEPGVKFIGNLNNGWQPYAGVSVVWNVMDKTQFQASDAALPELSVKPFVKYGIGIRKTWGERLVGFFQTFFTSGGRNGIGLQAGVRWTLGSAEPKHANSTGEKKFIAKK